MAKRLFSNNKIKDAGKILKNREQYSSDQIIDAEDILTYWRTISSKVIGRFQYHLYSRMSHLGLKGLVSQRLKRVPSIISKLSRFPTMQLSTMQDIAGVRIVLNNVEEVYKLKREFEINPSKSFTFRDEDDYITKPKDDGYRSLHLNYKFISDNESNEELHLINVEIQIRTKIQHIWATTVETLGTYLKFSLKSNEGPLEWIEFFKLASVAFSKLESMPVIASYCDLPDYEIFKELVHQFKVLDIEKKLSAFKVATNHISSKEYDSATLNLLVLNLDTRILHTKNFNDYENANKEYTKIERRIQDGENLQAVLVDTETVKDLKEAYPNYFLDIDEFVKKMIELELSIQEDTEMVSESDSESDINAFDVDFDDVGF